MNAPTISATRGAHIPAAFTTSSVSIASPSSSSTRRISRRGPSESKPVTRAFWRIRDAELARRIRDGERGRVRVEIAVAGQVDGAVQRLRRDRRHEPARLRRRDHADLQAHAACPARRALELLELLRRRREPDAAHRVEHAEPPVQLDRVAAPGEHRRARVERGDEPRGLRGGAAVRPAFSTSRTSVQPASAR